jgi:phosphatidylglycerophosphatase A
MRIAAMIASGFGAGRLPRAPGTAGSLFGLVAGAILLHFGRIPLSLGIVLASLAGLWAVPRTGAATSDPGWIVIDEIAGQMIAMLPLSLVSVRGLLLSFLLFRLFDIRKPFPISLADARHDTLGIMADDWLAGVFASVFIVILRAVWPGWGI